MSASPRMLMILSENWTLTTGRELPELVRWAQVAEDAGFDAVMISEHVVLGPDASAKGVMGNPRDTSLRTAGGEIRGTASASGRTAPSFSSWRRM